jgi:hypothetical protein
MIDLKTAFQFPIDPKSCHDDCFEFQWQVPGDLPYFEGHFPGQPMLPAVAVVDANTLIIEKVLEKPIQIQKLVTAKFTGPIQPDMKIRIKVQKNKEEQIWIFDWQEITESPDDKNLAHMALAFVFNIASDANL